MRLMYEKVHSGKHIALPNMVEHHPIYWGSDQNKRQRKGEFILSLFELGHQSSALGLGFTLSATLLFRPLHSGWDNSDFPGTQAFRFRLNHTISFPGCPACRCRSQDFLIRPILVLFLWRTLTQRVFQKNLIYYFTSRTKKE